MHNNEIPGQNSKLLVPHTSGNTNSAHNTMGDPKDPMKTATTTCIVWPRKMQSKPRKIYTSYERITGQERIQICPAENDATNPGKWTRDSGGPSPSGQTLPYPHPSVNPTVKHRGTAQMTAGCHHSPPDIIKQEIKYRKTVPFPLSLPHSAFQPTTHRQSSEITLVCCQPPIQHKGANPSY